MPFQRKLCAVLVAIFLVLFAVAGFAEEKAPSTPRSDEAKQAVKTGKERLRGKAYDEQRVDNCKVPPALRGPKPRPEDCQGLERPTADK